MIEKDVIIVGGGMSGLTAAAYLARDGRDVLLLEKNDHCGGLVNSFTHQGFLFEGGVRALLSAGIILPMLRDLGISLEMVPSRVSVGIEDKIVHVERQEDVEQYIAMLKALYPADEADIERLKAVIQSVMRDMGVLYQVENPAFHDFRQEPAYFLRHYVPWLFKFPATLYRMFRMGGAVEDYLTDLLPNRALRDIIDQHFFRGTPAFFALSYFYLYTDYLYPKGGVGQLAQKVTARVQELGGEIRTKTRVTGVDVAQRLLEDEHGNRYRYQNLIWAADLKTLYRLASTNGLPEPAQRRIAQERQKILRGRGADSVYTVYIGVDEPPETFANISHGHFFYTPSRQGLGEIHRAELKAMLANWTQVSRQEVLDWLDRFCKLTSYEISIPALKDPTAAPPGKTGLIVSVLFEYDLVKKVQEDGWYDEFKAAMEERMIAVLSQSIYPMLREKVLFRFSATPLTIAERVASSEGAIVGWSFEADVPVTHSLLQINNAVRTAFPHVYKAGQWSYSPTGVPTAILTGRLAAKAVT